MLTNINFYFKISKEAGMAHDDKGNPAECYMKLGFSLKKPVSEDEAEEEYNRCKDDAIKGAAHFLKIDINLVAIISEQEYLENTDDEGDED